MPANCRLTSHELADVLGITPTRVSQLKKDGLPSLPTGGHDLRAVTWYTDYLRGQAVIARSDHARARARLVSAQADRQELELAELRGELVSAEDVRTSAFNAARTARDALLAIPDRVAGLLAGMKEHDAHALLTGEIRRVVVSLSGAAAKAAGDGGSESPTTLAS